MTQHLQKTLAFHRLAADLVISAVAMPRHRALNPMVPRRVSSPILRVPVDAADQVAGAIERAREIDRRAQARLGGTWPYDNREERAPMPPLSAQELEALVGHLQLRYERALEGYG